MSKVLNKAKEIIAQSGLGISVLDIKQQLSTTENEWYRYSNKAYHLLLENEKKERKAILTKPHVAAASNEEISSLLELNNKLADYAISVPSFVTTAELETLLDLSKQLPASETSILEFVGKITFDVRMRVLQKLGRIEKVAPFKIFSKIIDAALISYYRTNFISCYLTLIPVIEGILIRWMGYNENDQKPEFEDIRKFFSNSASRQPCPVNIQFHSVYVKACHKILNQHFYKPTGTGKSYSDFNRHIASHLLNDNQFATKENCIRLFILLDTMTEIYVYETKKPDPRFKLKPDEITPDYAKFSLILLDNLKTTPEHLFFHTSKSDLWL